MKVVLDTNVLVSGLILPNSIPGHIVTAWQEARFDVVLSKAQLTEIARVLTYPKIAQRLRWGRTRVRGFLRQLYLRSELVEIRGVVSPVPSDRDDQPILASLIASGADCLVTGDSDLLEFSDRYTILTPSAFSQRYDV